MAPQSSVPGEDRYHGFPDGFFTRSDEDDDRGFYGQPRLVQHIDDGAIAAVRDLYDELGLYGEVLDLCSSWVSHLARTPQRLVVLGMNAFELERNPQAHQRVVKDLNREPALPFADASFDGAMCTVSVDYCSGPLRCSTRWPGCCGPVRHSCARSPTAASRQRPSGVGSPPTTSSTCGWWPSTSADRPAGMSPASTNARRRVTRSSPCGPTARYASEG